MQDLMSTELSSAQLARIAMFPLPGMVLFPGALLPLHIFEPRYREMTRDVLESTKILAMASVNNSINDGLPGSRPPVLPIVGLGRIVAAEETRDGRFYLVLKGIARARIAEEYPPVVSYRQIRAKILPDTKPSDPATIHINEKLLVNLCDQIAAELPKDGQELRKMIRESASPGECANIAAATLIHESDKRYALLENCDPSSRIEQTIEQIAGILSRLSPRAEFLN